MDMEMYEVTGSFSCQHFEFLTHVSSGERIEVLLISFVYFIYSGKLCRRYEHFYVFVGFFQPSNKLTVFH